MTKQLTEDGGLEAFLGAVPLLLGSGSCQINRDSWVQERLTVLTQSASDGLRVWAFPNTTFDTRFAGVKKELSALATYAGAYALTSKNNPVPHYYVDAPNAFSSVKGILENGRIIQ